MFPQDLAETLSNKLIAWISHTYNKFVNKDQIQTSFWVYKQGEGTLLSIAGMKHSRRTTLAKGFHKDDKEEAECSICHLYLHVSGLECGCSPGRRVCLHHADNLCECDPSRWRLVYRYSLQELEGILQQVCSHTPGEGMCLMRCDVSWGDLCLQPLQVCVTSWEVVCACGLP